MVLRVCKVEHATAFTRNPAGCNLNLRSRLRQPPPPFLNGTLEALYAWLGPTYLTSNNPCSMMNSGKAAAPPRPARATTPIPRPPFSLPFVGQLLDYLREPFFPSGGGPSHHHPPYLATSHPHHHLGKHLAADSLYLNAPHRG